VIAYSSYIRHPPPHILFLLPSRSLRAPRDEFSKTKFYRRKTITMTIWFCWKLCLNGKFAQRIPCTGRSTTVLCPVNLQEPLTITMSAVNDQDGTAMPPITVHHPFVIWTQPLVVVSLVFSITAKNQSKPSSCVTRHITIYDIVYSNRHIIMYNNILCARHIQYCGTYIYRVTCHDRYWLCQHFVFCLLLIFYTQWWKHYWFFFFYVIE